MKKRLYNFFAARLCILAWLSLAMLLLGQLFGRYVWQLELFTNFVPYYALTLFLASVMYPQRTLQNNSLKDNDLKGNDLRNNPLKNKPSKKSLFSRRFKPIRVLFMLSAIVLVIWSFAPSYELMHKWYALPSSMSLSTSEDTDEYTSESSYPPLIVYQNVNINNTQKAETLTALTQHNARTLILLEAGGEWNTHLEPFKKNYATHCGDDQASPFAMQVFSDKYATCEVVQLEGVPRDLPMIRLTQSAEQVVYVIHPPPPISAELAHYRLAYLKAVRELSKTEGGKRNVIVIGDMNTTKFSPVYRDFMQDSRLYTTESSLSTWRPLHAFNIPLGIGIDHYMMKMHWHDDVEFLGFNGSDHRGILIR